MKTTTTFLFFMMTFLVSRGKTFLLGNWRIPHYGGIVFTLDPTHLLARLEEKGAVIRMKHDLDIKNDQETRLTIGFSNLEIIQPPSDWYNIRKYHHALGIFHKLQKETLKVEFTILDVNTIEAVPSTQKEEAPFLLDRIL